MTLKLDWKRSLLFTAFISLLLILISVAQVVYAAAPGDIVINEIIPDPSAVSDANGEWFEVANTTAGAIDIDGHASRCVVKGHHAAGRQNNRR